ncbi:hypothetical protein Bbelb_178710 [Branchiostoma belcheri]|nr:hypothetical protein Bbelb_178710 [Branchiostoma belcheri]
MAFGQQIFSRKEGSALLVLVLAVYACTAFGSFCPQQCRKASRPVPIAQHIRSNLGGSLAKWVPFHIWTVCKGVNETVAVPQVIPCLTGYTGVVAVVGYPVGFVSVKTLAGLCPRCTATLALVKCEIADIEENVLAGISSLWMLALDYNKLTHIRQNCFSGLKSLHTLSLSNNEIVRVETGSFMDLGLLEILNLENNPLQTVDPDWFPGLQEIAELHLESSSIPLDAFQYLDGLSDLTLGGNFPFLDGDTFWGLRNAPLLIRVVRERLGTVRDSVVRDEAWSLYLYNHMDEQRKRIIRRQYVSLMVSNNLLCMITHDPLNNEQTLGYTSNVSNVYDPGLVKNISSSYGLSNILTESRAHFVVLLKTGSPNQHTPHDDTAQCRQGWEQNGTLLVALQDGLRMRLKSLWEGNTTMSGLAFTLFRTTQNTSTNGSATDNLKNFTQTNDRNITCLVLANENITRLVLTTVPPEDQKRNNKTCRPDSGHYCPPSNRTSTRRNQTQEVLTSEYLKTTSPASTPQVSTVLNTTAPDDTSIYPAIPIVSLLGLGLVLIVVMLKKVLNLSNTKDDRARIVPHATSGRARSASLPAIPHPHSDVPHRQVVPCRSLPTTLRSVEPTYCEIPDEAAHLVHHTYWEIPEGGMSDVNRSARTHTRREGREGAVSCQSLLSALPSTEPTYCNIPDSDNNDDDDAPLPFYGIAVDLTLPSVMGESRNIYLGSQPNLPAISADVKLCTEDQNPWISLGRSSRHLKKTSSRATAAYGRTTSQQRETFYGKVANATHIRSMPDLAKPSQSTEGQVYQSVLVQNVSSPTSRLNTYYWPWKIVEGGAPGRPCNPQRSASLTDLPNWAMELQRENGEYTPWRPSLATPQAASCPSGALPNSWPWGISGGSNKLQRRASLPSLGSTCNATPQNEVASNQTKH